jgi:hypothetical protein
MSYETTQVSAEVVNSAFIHKLESGQVKEAQEAGSAFIRQKLYEEGILRRLFEPRTLTADDLDPEEENDKPSILCEIEPDAPSATFVPFKGTGDRKYFNGKRFRTYFGKVEANRMSKSKFELMTIRMDIMSWLKENQVKQIQQEEDSQFMGTLTDILGAASATQTVTAAGTDTFKDSFVLGLKGMTGLRLPMGKVLMHKNTYLDSTKLKTEDIGFNPQEKRFRDGVDGEDSFMGYPVVTTIKDDLVAEGEMYFFAPEDYFLKFYLLQDATLFLKTEADMIEFFTYEAPGVGIGNTKGVFKVTLA